MHIQVTVFLFGPMYMIVDTHVCSGQAIKTGDGSYHLICVEDYKEMLTL